MVRVGNGIYGIECKIDRGTLQSLVDLYMIAIEHKGSLATTEESGGRRSKSSDARLEFGNCSCFRCTST